MASQIFDAVCISLTDEIQAYWAGDAPVEHRKKRLGSKTADKLLRSVERLVRDSVAVSYRRAKSGYASINLNSNAYTESRYQRGLSYRVHIERAYRGLLALGYLRQTQNGASNGTVGRYLTRYEATKKLTDLFGDKNLETLAVLMPAPTLDEQIIVQVSKTISRPGKKPIRVREKLEYEDTPETISMRTNVERLNDILRRHWIDLELTTYELQNMCDEMKGKQQAEDTGHDSNLDLSNRYLYRVFNDLGFERGGRFYGPWWQMIPKRYRERILIDGKNTVELDYSGLHPAILYVERGLTPPKDPYADILECPVDSEDVRKEYRDVVKRAFNAMLNASKPLSRAPSGLKLKNYGTTWKALSKAILEAHPAIADAFYSDCGARLQRIDSDLAEGVMLHFAAYSTTRPLVLPIHDSFIMHHGYEKELEDVMSALFRKRFNTTCSIDIKVKKHENIPLDAQISTSLAATKPMSWITLSDIMHGQDSRYEVALDAFRSNK